MANIALISSAFVEGMLRSETGLAQSVASLVAGTNVPIPDLTTLSIATRNVAAELAEKTAGTKYPAFHIYCDRISNSLREKFRKFSGGADMVIEIRVSHDHLEEVERQLHLYIDSVTDVLDRNRGAIGVVESFLPAGTKQAWGRSSKAESTFCRPPRSSST